MKILHIEDSQSDSFLTQVYLEEARLDYSLQTADRLSVVLPLLQSNKFDIILMDLNLPDGEGPALFMQVLDYAKGSPIIVLSGNNNEELEAELKRLGAADFLSKDDLDGPVLWAAIERSLATD